MKINKLQYNILFVEDEVATRSNYVQYLERYFNNVYEASNGEEALIIYQDKKPDLLIIDINMPKMNGMELLTKIRQNDEDTKVIMLTAYSKNEYIIKTMEFPNTKYLIKPITRSELEQTLELMLNNTL